MKLTKLAILGGTVASLVCVPAAGAATYPAGFEEAVLVSGLTRPTAVAWAPDGRTFVIEKDGNLKVVAPGALDRDARRGATRSA